MTDTFEEAGLDVALRIVNTGEKTLPASVGDHPAFNWPLQPERPDESYALTFDNEESSPVRRLEAGCCVRQGSKAPSKARSFFVRISVHRRRRHLRSHQQHFCPLCDWARTVAGNVSGPAFASSASGQSRQAPRSYASSPGVATPARRTSTASSVKSRV